MVKIAILLLALTLSIKTLSNEHHILRFRSNIFHKKKEQALVLRKNTTTAVRNTNALCGPELVSEIGEFERASTDLDKANYMLIKQISKRLHNRKKSNIYFQERDTKFFIDGFDISKDKIKKKIILNLILEACNIKKWKRIQSAESKIIKKHKLIFLQTIIHQDKKRKINLVLFSQANCKKVGNTKETKNEIYDCPIPSFGFVRLISPFNTISNKKEAY